MPKRKRGAVGHCRLLFHHYAERLNSAVIEVGVGDASETEGTIVNQREHAGMRGSIRICANMVLVVMSVIVEILVCELSLRIIG